MASDLKRTSKFLSWVLRPRPDALGLELDAGGWANVDALIAAARANGGALDRATLERVVAENDKRRFALSPDGARIRAVQGHSVEVDLGLEPAEPPETLFHGTAERSLPSILREGLRPGSRRHVHLSPDAETARAVGSRHGRPAVVRVAAGALHRAGHPFYQAENGVWLTGAVPAERLVFPGDSVDEA